MKNILEIPKRLIDKKIIEDTFVREQYKWLVTNLRAHTTAIDIGAYIGDSPVYLAQRVSIDKVLAYESNPTTYKRGLEFIEKSPLRKKIKYLNRAINDLKDMGFDIKKNTIIKCDCEGSEHDIFNSHADLKNVYKMQIEYHDGVKDLIKVLASKGFRVSREITENKDTDLEVGWLYCSRKGS